MTGPADLLEPVPPLYGRASLADVMPSVLAVLGVRDEPDVLGLTEALAGVRRVAVLLCDGLGWYQLPVAAPSAPTLADLATGLLGSTRPITCGFPSTTPTSLVTLGTGRAPGTHGVVGFNLRIPGTSTVLNHLEWRTDPDPRTWQPVPTAFERATAAGVRATVVNNVEFLGTGLTTAAYRGAEYRGTTSAVDERAAEILAALAAGPGLVYGYFGDVDSKGHLFGIDSPEWHGAVETLDRLLTQVVAGLPEDAALLVTADHGQLNVPPEGRLDLDLDPRLRAGVAVVAGEARVRYLHALPGARDDVLAAWREALGVRGSVLTREEAVAAGWFGPIGEEHAARLGDVVAMCRDDAVVVASKTEPAHVARFVGYHGSSTATEMTIPLLIATGRR